MEVVGHQTIRQERHVIFFTRVSEYGFKECKIVLFKKDWQPSICTIKNVIWVAANIDAQFPRHVRIISR